MADVYEQLTLDREFEDFGDWVKAQPATHWKTLADVPIAVRAKKAWDVARHEPDIEVRAGLLAAAVWPEAASRARRYPNCSTRRLCAPSSASPARRRRRSCARCRPSSSLGCGSRTADAATSRRSSSGRRLGRIRCLYDRNDRCKRPGTAGTVRARHEEWTSCMTILLGASWCPAAAGFPRASSPMTTRRR